MNDRIDEPGFDWAAPRWRDVEDGQDRDESDLAEAARVGDRRFRDRLPPEQRGAIDGDDSVAGHTASDAEMAGPPIADATADPSPEHGEPPLDRASDAE